MCKDNNTTVVSHVNNANTEIVSVVKRGGIYEITHKDGITVVYHTSDGNRKPKPTEKVNFLIFNLLARYTCPFRTILCGGDEDNKGKCYAFKAENVYPEVKPARMDNYKATLLQYFVIDMVYIIADRVKKQRKQKLVVRIHESGDFYSQMYADKWLAIADRISKMDFGKKVVKMMAYTKSFPYFDGKNIPNVLKVRASLWADTKPEMLEIVKRNGWHTYSAVDKFDGSNSYTECHCKDCGECEQCWAEYEDIRCEIH